MYFGKFWHPITESSFEHGFVYVGKSKEGFLAHGDENMTTPIWIMDVYVGLQNGHYLAVIIDFGIGS